MSQIQINNHSYTYVVDFKENTPIRKSFSRLAKQTFGLDFESWYKLDFWHDQYIPHALLDGEKLVANISVSIMDFKIDNKDKRFIQIGTVMTDPDYRGRGLAKFLLEDILLRWKDTTDLIYLFANDSVIEFYPKFGFTPCHEYQYSKNLLPKAPSSKPRKLDMTLETDQNKLVKAIQTHTPLAKLSMYNNLSLLMFYCTSLFKDCIYSIDSLETIAICEYRDDTLYVHDIFSSKMVRIGDVIDCLRNLTICKVILGFTPEDDSAFEDNQLDEENSTLFTLGDSDFLQDEKLMFPTLSHT